MQTIKQKIHLTIDKNVCDAVENASNTYNIAMSQLIQQALELWCQKKETEILMADGYEAMYHEDREFSGVSFEAQQECLS